MPPSLTPNLGLEKPALIDPAAIGIINVNMDTIDAAVAAATAAIGELAVDATSVKAFGAVGDGVVDDTLAIQAAIDAVSLNAGGGPTATAHRGGTVYFPPGIYKVTASIRIEGPNVRLLGPSWGLSNKSATPDQGTAAYLLNALPNVAAFPLTYPFILQITGAANWITTGVSVENLGFVCTNNTFQSCVQMNTYSGVNGISRVQFVNCDFLSGVRGVQLVGSAYIFDLQFIGCHFQPFDSVNQVIGYDQSTPDTSANGGISTVFRDCTFRGHNSSEFYFGSPAGNVTIENCTLESCVGPSIRWVGNDGADNAGTLTLISNHWEGIEQGAAAAGGHMVSSVTTDWAAIVHVDKGITQLNIVAPDVQLSTSATPANAIPFVASNAAYDGRISVTLIGGLVVPTVAPTMGQPYFRFARASSAGVVHFNALGTRFGPLSGAGALLSVVNATLLGDHNVSGVGLDGVHHVDSLRIAGNGGADGGRLGYQLAGGLAQLFVGDGTARQGIDVNAWRDSWVPTISQAGVRASTKNWARYQIVGRLCTLNARVTITAAGSSGSPVVCSAPIVPAFTTGNHVTVGSFVYRVGATSNVYVGAVEYVVGTGFKFYVNQGGAATDGIGHLPAFATANGDVLEFTASYET